MSEHITVGSEFLHYCTKCKLKLMHFVTVAMNGEAIKIQCKTCKKIGKYSPEKEKRVAKKKITKAKEEVNKVTINWSAARKTEPINYSIRKTFKKEDVIFHPRFSLGVVIKSNKNNIEVKFEDGEVKTLVHGK